jgi:hypothetical protein
VRNEVDVDLSPAVRRLATVVATQLGVEPGELTSGEAPRFAILRNNNLDELRTAVRWLDKGAIALAVAALAVAALAIVVAEDHRTGFRRVAVGLGAGAVLSLAAIATGRIFYFDALKDEVRSPDAAKAVFDTVSVRLRDAFRVVLAVALVLGAVVWVAGPSSPARRLRAWARGEGDGGSVARGAARYRRSIQWLVLGLAATVLAALAHPGTSALLTILAITLVVLVVVRVLAARGADQPADVGQAGAAGAAPTAGTPST